MEKIGQKPIEDMGTVFGISTEPITEWVPFNLDCWMRIYADEQRVHFTHRIVKDMNGRWAEYVVILDDKWENLPQSIKEYYRESVQTQFNELKKETYGIERS